MSGVPGMAYNPFVNEEGRDSYFEFEQAKNPQLLAEIELEGNDDESLNNLAKIHNLLALKITKQDDRQPTKQSEGNSPSDWMKEGTCLSSNCGMEGHVCGNGHFLKTLSEQHRQLAKLYGRLSMLDKNEMELIADCHGVT